MGQARLALPQNGDEFAHRKLTMLEKCQNAKARRLACRAQGFYDGGRCLFHISIYTCLYMSDNTGRVVLLLQRLSGCCLTSSGPTLKAAGIQLICCVQKTENINEDCSPRLPRAFDCNRLRVDPNGGRVAIARQCQSRPGTAYTMC